MAKLIFIGEKFNGRVYEFAVEKTTVGRGDHNTLTIHDASVSQSHGEILVNGTEVIVRDLASSNGTFVNGVRLHDQQRPLQAGQLVRFGSIEARLELDAPSMDETATDVTAVHSHARHLREREKPAKPAPAEMTLDGGASAASGDHTLVLPRSTGANPAASSASPAGSETEERSARPVMLALVVAVVVVGLAVLCWLILARNR